VFLTGHGDIPMSVRAMQAGAVEFLTKPFRWVWRPWQFINRLIDNQSIG